MKMHYEYFDDADMAMGQDIERRVKNSRRRDFRLAKRFITDMQLIYLILTVRRLQK